MQTATASPYQVRSVTGGHVVVDVRSGRWSTPVYYFEADAVRWARRLEKIRVDAVTGRWRR